MKIDMLQALSLINLNSACIKCENIESDFLSVLDNEVINGNILEETNKVKVEKSLINEDEQRELREVDEKLIEFIGALLNKINSNNYENKVEVKDIYNQEIKGDNRVTEMTAKSEMVYDRLLSLGGKGGTDSYKIRLFAIKLSSVGPRKIIRPSIYHRAITD